MATERSAAEFMGRLMAMRSDEQQEKIKRYFKAGKDEFIGVRMGQLFALAKEFAEMAPREIEVLLESPIHEARAGALAIMSRQAVKKKTGQERRRELFELYLRRHDRIDNWDLVDLAAPKVVGAYLWDYDQPRDLLFELSKSGNLWERRTAIVATLYFIGRGEVETAFRVAEALVYDREDLIHKAVGWALRYGGDKNRPRLLEFLDRYAATMPRTMLRGALEHFEGEERAHYMGLRAAKA